MRKRTILLLAALLLLTVDASAAKKKVGRQTKANTAQVVRDYIDSLAVLRKRLDSLEIANKYLRQEATDGRYMRLFAPTTFYHSSANKALSLSPNHGDDVTDAVDAALLALYMRRPDLVKNSQTKLEEAGTLIEDVNKEMTQHVELTKKVAPNPEVPQEELPVQVMVQKPNFWKLKFDGALQFMQNYVSDNWHKGGESNYSAVGEMTFEFNYNDKDKILFENKLEAKLGFLTSQSDTVHKFKTNNDMLRFTSKFGLQAHKHWYYTLQLLTYTQFARGFKANDSFVYSDFMSPFKLNVGLGMEYKVEALNKRLTGSVNILPFSFIYTYVARKALASRNGVSEGHHSIEDFGSQFTCDLKWQLAEQISWKTRFYANTSYHHALVEWENQIELKVSKYISANIFLYPRFDDAYKWDDDMGYFQFQEYSSLGLSVSF